MKIQLCYISLAVKINQNFSMMSSNHLLQQIILFKFNRKQLMKYINNDNDLTDQQKGFGISILFL